MAASVSGAKTVTVDVSPKLSAATMTTRLATAVENLTVAQFYDIRDALKHLPAGNAETTTIGSLFN